MDVWDIGEYPDRNEYIMSSIESICEKCLWQLLSAKVTPYLLDEVKV